MVSGSGSGEWRVKGRLLTSVQYYSTIKGPLETLEMLNLRLYILSSLYLTQTGEGTIYSLYSASFYPVLSNEVLFEIFRGSLISDISCLAYGWHLLCYTGWFLQYLMRADFIVLGRTIVVLNQYGFYALYYVISVPIFFCYNYPFLPFCWRILLTTIPVLSPECCLLSSQWRESLPSPAITIWHTQL